MQQITLKEPNDVWELAKLCNQFNFCSTVIEVWDQVTSSDVLATIWEFFEEVEAVSSKELPELIGEKGFYHEIDIVDYIGNSNPEYFNENKRLVLLALQVADDRVNSELQVVI
jgi:hypothetical protein